MAERRRLGFDREMNGQLIAGSATPSSWHLIGKCDMHFISSAPTGTVSATALSDEFVFTSVAPCAHSISSLDPS
jgi:hypothetical protein